MGLETTDLLGQRDELPLNPLLEQRYEWVGSTQHFYARNDNKKSKCKSRSRFPAGMTTRKAKTRTGARTKAHFHQEPHLHAALSPTESEPHDADTLPA
jgi:hypothetical protein